MTYKIYHTDNDGKTLIEPEATQDTLDRYMAAYTGIESEELVEPISAEERHLMDSNLYSAAVVLASIIGAGVLVIIAHLIN